MKSLKSLLVLIIALGLTMATLQAQKSGEILYEETMKLDIQTDDAPGGVDLTGMLPASRSVTKKLTFNENESVYEDSGDGPEDTEFSSDDGSIEIKIMASDIESILYTNYDNEESLDQQGFMDRAFIISKPVTKLKWKITPEKVKYLDYECMKATTTDEEGREIVAWFAPAIPVNAGPSGYGQLPGAILMLSRDDQKLEIKATRIELKEVDTIKKPNDGKKVTMEEYDKIVEEKMKEMEKEYGGRSLMIRG
ncbi:MAG: GLPGLI family protein [Bacteroidota bacterium]